MHQPTIKTPSVLEVTEAYRQPAGEYVVTEADSDRRRQTRTDGDRRDRLHRLGIRLHLQRDRPCTRRQTRPTRHPTTEETDSAPGDRGDRLGTRRQRRQTRHPATDTTDSAPGDRGDRLGTRQQTRPTRHPATEATDSAPGNRHDRLGTRRQRRQILHPATEATDSEPGDRGDRLASSQFESSEQRGRSTSHSLVTRSSLVRLWLWPILIDRNTKENMTESDQTISILMKSSALFKICHGPPTF